MRVALINGSPKAKGAASGVILQELRTLLGQEHHVMHYHWRMATMADEDFAQFAECDALVFAFPLYVDGIPSHLLNCLEQLEQQFIRMEKASATVYALVNCGFFEGQQCALALQMVRHWSVRAGLVWGQGLGIGGGGMMASIPGLSGPKKDYGRALRSLAEQISISATAPDLFSSPNFPRFAYKLAAEFGWRQQIKANGLRVKDMSAKR